MSVWRHKVLPFGSAPSVWHFNRCTDALVWLARSLTLVLALHYVDDVGGPEPDWAASSSCEKFRELCEIIGIRVKPSKEQLPAVLQKVLGVWLSIHADRLEVRPDSSRLTKMIHSLQSCLETDQLRPEEAHRLCGKLVLLQSILFGMVGMAAMHPLYARSHGGSEQSLELNQGLRGAIQALIALLGKATPRCIPLRRGGQQTSIVYADAFLKLGERAWKAGHAQVRHWTRAPVSTLTNGWGFLVRAGSDITAGHGAVPADIVSCFNSRKAYIFFLEVNAQLLALLPNRGRLDSFWVCFIDNTAGLAALAKGFSKESAVNNLLAFFWCLCAELGWFGHFECVASKLNPADPVSRGELQSAIKYGAAFLQGVPGGYWQLLRQVATSMTFATGDAVQQALQLEFSFGGFERPF